MGARNARSETDNVLAYASRPDFEPMPEFDPPYEVLEPLALSSPLVVSSPHSGSIYPQSFIERSRLDPLALRRSEDAYVDELFLDSVAAGAPMLRARFPRAFLDVNREPYELDPRMFDGRLPPQSNTRSVRVAGGLGTIARVVSEAMEIYKDKLPVSEIERRLHGLYHPYHRALRRLIERSWRGYGMAVLLDCHSMPSLHRAGPIEALSGQRRPEIIIGDRYGASCDAQISDFLDTALTRAGFAVQRNKPYAGGFITEHYGSPTMGMQAIQIEINRALYMDETTLAPKPEFANVKRRLGQAITAFMAHIEEWRRPAAAAE